MNTTVKIDRNYEPVEAYKLTQFNKATGENEDISEQEWLKLRTNGIGGSDSGIIMGVSPFRSTYDLYMEKKGIKPVSDNKNQMILDAGHKLENLIAQAYLYIMNTDAKGKTNKPICKIYEKKIMYRHPIHTFMQADIDRLVELTYPDGTVEYRILEIKSTSENNKDKWMDNKIPQEYIYQGRHYMSVMNIEQVDYICLFCPEMFRMLASIWNDKSVSIDDEHFTQFMDMYIIPNTVIRHIKRDDSQENLLVKQEQDFWENNILKNNPPKVYDYGKGEVSLKSLLKYINPSDEKITVPESQDITDNIISFENLKYRKSQIEKELKIIKDTMSGIEANLLSMFKDGGNFTTYTVDGQEYFISYKDGSVRESIQKKNLIKLKEQYPEIYENFVTKTVSKRSLKLYK